MRLGKAYTKCLGENPCSSQHERQHENIVDRKRKTINYWLERLYSQID